MKKFNSFLMLFAFVAAFLLTSCKPQSPGCVIQVKDKAGAKAMAGVKVELYATVMTPAGAPTTADLKADGITDSEGKIHFTFKNPCVMDVKATVTNCTGTYCTGTGIVKLEEGKTNQKTVYINN